MATVRQDAIRDIVGGMVDGNTETNISVTYDDVTRTLDFVVGPDLTGLDSIAVDTINEKTTDAGVTVDGVLLKDGGAVFSGDILPDTDNTGNVGTGAATWNNGRFTSLQIDNTLTVRNYIDLADNDGIRWGSSDDVRVFYDGTANDWEFEMEAAALTLTWTDNATKRMQLTKSTGDLELATGSLFVTASGEGIDFGGGDVTVLYTANALAFAGATSGYSFDGRLTVNGNITTVSSNGDNYIGSDTAEGLRLIGKGSTYDFALLGSSGGAQQVLNSPTGTGNVQIPNGDLTVAGTYDGQIDTDGRFFIRDQQNLANGIALTAVNSANSAFRPMELQASQFLFSQGNLTMQSGSEIISQGSVRIGGTSYQAGVLGYTDSNWGYLHRPPVAGALGAHLFEAYDGTDLLKIENGGDVSVEAGHLSIAAGNILYFDGQGGGEYIQETSGTLYIGAGGSQKASFGSTGIIFFSADYIRNRDVSANRYRSDWTVNGATGTFLNSYDDTGAVYKDMYIDASNLYLRPNGTTVATVTTSLLSVAGDLTVSAGLLDVTNNASNQIAEFDTNATNGGYISIEDGGTIRGFLGYGSTLFSGLADTDFGIRSQGDLILGVSGTTGRLVLDNTTGDVTVTAGNLTLSDGNVSATESANGLTPGYFRATHASYTHTVIQAVASRAASTAFNFFDAYANSVQKATIRGDGNHYNSSGTYGAISDLKTKHLDTMRPAPDFRDKLIALSKEFVEFQAKSDVEQYGEDGAKFMLSIPAQNAEAISDGLVGTQQDTERKVVTLWENGRRIEREENVPTGTTTKMYNSSIHMMMVTADYGRLLEEVGDIQSRLTALEAA